MKNRTAEYVFPLLFATLAAGSTAGVLLLDGGEEAGPVEETAADGQAEREREREEREREEREREAVERFDRRAAEQRPAAAAETAPEPEPREKPPGMVPAWQFPAEPGMPNVPEPDWDGQRRRFEDRFRSIVPTVPDMGGSATGAGRLQNNAHA